MVFFKLGTSSSLGKKEGVFIPPEKSDRWLPEKSGYSRSHRLKPASTPAIAGLKISALARNSRTNSRVETEGFSPQSLGSPAQAGLGSGYSWPTQQNFNVIIFPSLKNHLLMNFLWAMIIINCNIGNPISCAGI
jgi:hypothetical protein